MVLELHLYEQRDLTMQAFVVGATLAGSPATAFVLQRALLEAWLRAMDPNHGRAVAVHMNEKLSAITERR